jgi:hypothetical protein
MRYLPLILCLLTSNIFAQTSTIKGVVKDNVSEETLIGAGVQLVEIVEKSTVTDENGVFYIKDLTPGRYTLIVTYTGYEPTTIPNVLVTSGKETDLEIKVQEGLTLQEAVITASADKDKAINELATVSARTFSLEEVTRYSGGRNDASRIVANFAGVSTSNDSRNDIVIRGNSPAGVLWRLEGVPIPNPNHFSTLGTTGGPVSALNTNLLKNSDFLTSAFPSEYGNALSGVFDLGFRSGNKDKVETTFQLAAFSGLEAMIEGPLSKKKDKSFLVSYRYSFVQLADYIGLNFGTTAIPKYQDLSFNFDFGKSKLGNFKIFGIAAKSNIQFLGRELSEEDFFAEKDADSKAVSQIGFVGVKHTLFLNDKNYFRTVVGLANTQNRYDEQKYTDTSYAKSYLNTDVNDRINRISVNSMFNTKMSNNLSGRVGILLDNKNLVSKVSARSYEIDKDKDGLNDLFQIRNIDGNVTTLEPYATVKWRANQELDVTFGLHGQVHTQVNNFAIEPRLGINYRVGEKSSVNLGYGLHSQLQPLPVFFLLSPDNNNNLLPLNGKLDFSKAHHTVLGYDYKPAANWRVKAETYFQYLYNVPVEKESSSFSILNAGADFVFPQVGNLVNEGTGENYGIELTIEKFFSEKYYALVTASVFESKYKGSDGIKRNTAFNNEYVVNFLLGKEWKITNSMDFTTDIKFTTAGGRYASPILLEASRLAKTEIRDESKAYSEKLGAYVRLDTKIGVRMNKKGWSQQFFFDFQNVTNHKNVFLKKYGVTSQNETTVYQIGFFPDLLWRVQF